MKKTKLIYILLALINISLITFLILKFVGNNNKNEISNENNTISSDGDNNPSEDMVVTYKKFTLTIPSNIKYEEEGMYIFTLNGDTFDATVEIFVMDVDDIYENKDAFFEELINEDYKVDGEELLNTSYGKALTYKSTDENNKKLYGYYKLFNPYFCEIILHNSDNSFDTANLEYVMKILSSYQYDNETTERYYYHRVTLNK
jgi:hypothetical protein